MGFLERKFGRKFPFAQPIAGLAFLIGLALFGGQPAARSAKERVRLAYFPNLTHAPGVAGVARGEFQKVLPDGVEVDPKVFNAGPEEMEALLAGEVDLGYVGPSPAINTYLKSNGKALRVLAGASSGGASLIARQDTAIRSIRDLDGKRLAVPQLGGTQDVSARLFLAAHNLQPKERGGTVELLPIKNPDILALFKQGQLDAAWVPEPWASRLVRETAAKRVVDERDLWPGGRFSTTVVVVRSAYLEEHPERVQRLLQAHLRSLEWLKANADEGQKLVNSELKRLTGKQLPAQVLQDAWERVEFTDDPLASSISTFVDGAVTAGFLPERHLDLAGLIDPTPLERARRGSLTASRP